MIDVKEAVKIATEYVNQMYDQIDLRDLMPEEVEVSDDEQYWFVTLGFSTPYLHEKESVSPLFRPSFPGSDVRQRVYKVFKIRADDGQVRAMKIRET